MQISTSSSGSESDPRKTCPWPSLWSSSRETARRKSGSSGCSCLNGLEERQRRSTPWEIARRKMSSLKSGTSGNQRTMRLRDLEVFQREFWVGNILQKCAEDEFKLRIIYVFKILVCQLNNFGSWFDQLEVKSTGVHLLLFQQIFGDLKIVMKSNDFLWMLREEIEKCVYWKGEPRIFNLIIIFRISLQKYTWAWVNIRNTGNL